VILRKLKGENKDSAFATNMATEQIIKEYLRLSNKIANVYSRQREYLMQRIEKELVKRGINPFNKKG